MYYFNSMICFSKNIFSVFFVQRKCVFSHFSNIHNFGFRQDTCKIQRCMCSTEPIYSGDTIKRTCPMFDHMMGFPTAATHIYKILFEVPWRRSLLWEPGQRFQRNRELALCLDWRGYDVLRGIFFKIKSKFKISRHNIFVPFVPMCFNIYNIYIYGWARSHICVSDSICNCSRSPL